eukprot:scaffold6394_cov71-Phaeocystis_antarctica.AAC.1
MAYGFLGSTMCAPARFHEAVPLVLTRGAAGAAAPSRAAWLARHSARAAARNELAPRCAALRGRRRALCALHACAARHVAPDLPHARGARLLRLGGLLRRTPLAPLLLPLLPLLLAQLVLARAADATHLPQQPPPLGGPAAPRARATPHAARRLGEHATATAATTTAAAAVAAAVLPGSLGAKAEGLRAASRPLSIEQRAAARMTAAAHTHRVEA